MGGGEGHRAGGDSGSRERTALGKEARLDFCSLTVPRGRPSRPVMSAGPRRRGHGGPVGPSHGPLPTFRHFREKQMTASVSQMSSSSSTALTPLACPERPPQPEGDPHAGAGGPGHRVVSVDACDSPSAVLLLTSHFPKRKEINIQIHLSSKWSFAAKKKKSYSSFRGSGGKAAWRYVRGNAERGSARSGLPEGQN